MLYIETKRRTIVVDDDVVVREFCLCAICLDNLSCDHHVEVFTTEEIFS